MDFEVLYGASFFMLCLFALFVLLFPIFIFIAVFLYILGSWIGGVEGSNATIGTLFKIKYILCLFGVMNFSLTSLKKSKIKHVSLCSFNFL